MQKVFIPSVPMRYDVATERRVPSLDLNPAAQFGELVHLIDEPGNPQDDIDTVLQRLTEEFAPGDFVLCVGDLLLIAAAVACASKLHGKVKVLRWDRKQHHYHVAEVAL